MAFPTTQLSLVLALKSTKKDARAAGADQLARLYWIPIYKYLRQKWRQEPHDAEDTTQAFFVKLSDREMLTSFEPKRGRLRTYLRRCVDNFVIDETRRAKAARRGSGLVGRFDLDAAERELAGASELDDPDELFAREWRQRLISLASAELEDELSRKKKEQHLAVFKRLYLSTDPPTHADLAKELEISTVDVNNRLAYAKRAFRRILVTTLRNATIDEAEYQDEARFLGILSEK